MLKKIGVLAIVYIVASLHAEEFSPAWFELKPGYFFFANHTLREIYHGGFEIQGSISYPLWQMIYLYGSLGYLEVKGKSLNDNQKTSIAQVPLDVGVRAIATITDYVQSYVSIGPRYFYVHQHNDSIYVNSSIRKHGLGFFINGGCNFITTNLFLVGIFGEYAFEQKSFSSTLPNVYGRRKVQVGGFTFGTSVGVEF